MWKKKEVSTELEAGKDYTPRQLDEIADAILREDARTEMCRVCHAIGEKTNKVKVEPQFRENGDELTDATGNQLVLQFPEIQCSDNGCGNLWYQGEGEAKGIGSKYAPPILFEEHIISRKRREILNQIGVPDPEIVSGLYNRCVDAQTEALTPQGWRDYNSLSKGDQIWTYDIDADRCEWQPLLDDPYVATHIGYLQVLESQNISARVTEGHRWAVAHERDKLVRYEVTSKLILPKGFSLRDPKTGRICRQGLPQHLASRHYIPLARPPKIDGSTHQALFELLGWVLSDGTYRVGKNDCVVYQAMHNKKLPKLLKCLAANGVTTEPSFIDHNNVGRWAIPAAVGRPLRVLTYDTKRVASINLAQYSNLEYESIYAGLLGGDGYLRRSHYIGEIQTTCPNESSAIQALVSRIGHTSYSTHNHQPTAFCPDMYPVNCKSVSWAYVRPALCEPEWYEGDVWCPTVANGYWLARRSGKTYVTGNSHPQGRKINSSEARSKHGASWYRAVTFLPIFSVRFPLVMLGILSVGVLLWMIAKRELNTQLTCENIILSQSTEKRRGLGTGDTLPLTGWRPEREPWNGDTLTTVESWPRSKEENAI